MAEGKHAIDVRSRAMSSGSVQVRHLEAEANLASDEIDEMHEVVHSVDNQTRSSEAASLLKCVRRRGSRNPECALTPLLLDPETFDHLLQPLST